MVENPYFDTVTGGVTVGGTRASTTPQAVATLERRPQLVQRYAWAIPNWEAIETVVDYEPLLEVGAGNGYWAALVYEAGGDIVATDSLQDLPGEPPAWTDVEPLDARAAIDRYGSSRSLFICWPNEDGWAANALKAYGEAGGRTLVYVGEGRGGCTGDERFHRTLYRDWRLVETVAIPRYLGLRDRLEVWQRPTPGEGGEGGAE